jgi:hypothetical protein
MIQNNFWEIALVGILSAIAGATGNWIVTSVWIAAASVYVLFRVRHATQQS